MSSRRSIPSFVREPGPSCWLAVLRIYAGGWLLWLGISQLLHHFISDFPHLINECLAHQFFEFYRLFLSSFVIPNAEAIAVTLIVAEIVTGLLLILGLLTRVSTLIALVIALNYFLAREDLVLRCWHRLLPELS